MLLESRMPYRGICLLLPFMPSLCRGHDFLDLVPQNRGGDRQETGGAGVRRSGKKGAGDGRC